MGEARPSLGALGKGNLLQLLPQGLSPRLTAPSSGWNGGQPAAGAAGAVEQMPAPARPWWGGGDRVRKGEQA